MHAMGVFGASASHRRSADQRPQSWMATEWLEFEALSNSHDRQRHNLDFMNADAEITPQHYAFLVSESELTKSLIGFASSRIPTGLILLKRKPVRSITTTVVAVFISRIPTATS